MRSLPSSLVNLYALSVNLTTLNLTSNKIRRLEVSTDPELYVAVQDLFLDDNELEFIDMEFFVPLKRLSLINLGMNWQINFSDWDAPLLHTLELHRNQLEQLPIAVERLPALYLLQLSSNNLTTLDLGLFINLTKLMSIDASDNQLSTVLPASLPDTNQTIHPVTLPALEILYLKSNVLTHIDFDRLNLPALESDGQCVPSMGRACLLPVLNMLTDGLVVLRNVPVEDYSSVRVELLRLPENPSGIFLQRVAQLVNRVEMYVFQEQTINIMPDNILQEVALYQAKALRQVLFGTNVLLNTFTVYGCSLDRIPATLPNAQELGELRIDSCNMKGFTFDAFARNSKLTVLDLSRNQISQIFPSILPELPSLAIESLYLSSNQLENVDMTAFASLTALRMLSLEYNNLLRLAAERTVTWPVLEMIDLHANQLQTLDLQWLVAPNLKRLMLDENRFQTIPPRLRRFPSLQMLGMGMNNFSGIDLAPLNGLPNLTVVDFSYNAKARFIRTSRPIQLPSVTYVTAENCALQRFNTTGMDMPMISYIGLRSNNFSTVPPLRKAFPSLETYSLEGSPLSCAAIKNQLDTIVAGFLILGPPQTESSCPFGTYKVSQQYTVCYTMLQLRSGCRVRNVEMGAAPFLASIAIDEPNHELEVLDIRKSAMRSLPSSLVNLYALRYLLLRDGQLETINLEPLRNSANLTKLDLTSNKIRRLEISTGPELYVAVQDLFLDDNALEFIDMEFFTPLRRLRHINLELNRLKRIVASEGKIIRLPALITLILNDNYLKQLNFTDCDAPLLHTLELCRNQLEQQPIAIRRLEISTDPELYVAVEELILSDNELEFIDMEFFVPLKRLAHIELKSNRLKQFKVSQSKIYRFPALQTLLLMDNYLKQLNFTDWDAPLLARLDLYHNKLTQQPIAVERLRGLIFLRMTSNHLTTLDLRSFVNLTNLTTLHVSNNRLRMVLPSSLPDTNHATHPVTLPMLQFLLLQSNALAHIDFDRLNLPALEELNLSNNLFRRLPNVFTLYPLLRFLKFLWNPIVCADLQALELYISARVLWIETSQATAASCSTNTWYKGPTGEFRCCSA
ncbi:uncharacterized protein LOC126576811 [Anopheles aquasalis]|uniref:uncharacterized protein LOC126576811 n=1 Tax=Anopheles aquasalis TaxID=42839 RepID=UPI00215B060A|nr:uncharacterized protein LOC126576811 [Anopheles aquasalis]